jgi:quinol monooxygenase YgiN
MGTASLCFRVRPHKAQEVLSAMEVLADRMRRAPGCARSRLLADVEDPCSYTLTSDWEDSAAADAFMESRDFLVFRGIRILLREEPYLVLDEVRSQVTRLLRATE